MSRLYVEYIGTPLHFGRKGLKRNMEKEREVHNSIFRFTAWLTLTHRASANISLRLL